MQLVVFSGELMIKAGWRATVARRLLGMCGREVHTIATMFGKAKWQKIKLEKHSFYLTQRNWIVLYSDFKCY